MTCPWCLSPGPSDYPCCVPAWFWQIGVHEACAKFLKDPYKDVIRFPLNKYNFRPPDNLEEYP